MELPRFAAIQLATSRRFAGQADYRGMAELITAVYRADGVEQTTSEEEVATGYAHLQNCDPATDMVMVEIEERLVAYCRVWWSDELNSPRIYYHLGYVHPDNRRRGIGTALVAWALGRIEEIASGHDPNLEKRSRAWADGGEVGATTVLERAGYKPATYAAMMLRPDLGNIPDAPLPDGVEIRPAADADLRKIFDADSEAFRDHWAYRQPTETDWEQFLAFPHRDESLWKVAWHDDQVVGQVRSFIDQEENQELGLKRGWTEFISTARDWRRRGVATALICESLRELRNRGMEQAALGVHTENPNGAFRLYESLGYKLTRLDTIYERPVPATALTTSTA